MCLVGSAGSLDQVFSVGCMYDCSVVLPLQHLTEKLLADHRQGQLVPLSAVFQPNI